MIARLAILVIFWALGSADLPRGASLSMASFYKVAEEFKCIDGSKKIPFEQVNDDFCDCPDGSDEPGTSACPNGRFFCANDGHESHFIPSSRVNDKICDCCDGSDEWGSGVKCSNICNELGKAAREENERKAAVARKGWKAREELAKKGKEIKQENEAKIVPIKAERDQLAPKKDDLEAKKKDAEEAERVAKDEHRKQWEDERNQKKRAKADEVFKQFDLDGNGKITLDDLRNNPLFDANSDGVTDEEEAKIYLINTEEADMEHFAAQMYDSIRIRMRQVEDEKKDVEKETVEDDLVAESEIPNETVEMGSEPSTQPSVSEKEEYAIDEDKMDHPEDHHEDEDEYGRMPEYTESVQKLIDDSQKIRDEWSEVNNKIVELDRQIREAESFLEQDFGGDLAWAALKGQCFDLNEMQYTYKFCPFEKTVQKDKNGYSETRLGDFASWSGNEPRKYSEQKYDKGQQCWNGPQRSTQVVIECGEENELVEATEPAKCEYRFVFRTPAACNDPDRPEPVHTEL